MIKISLLTNLGVLTIGRNLTTPDIGLDDSIIRSWGRTASISDAFSLLRVLNCRSQKDITAGVFAHLNQFPALSLFNVDDCSLGSKDRQAGRNHGWNYKTEEDLSDWLVNGDTTSAGWDSIVHASFRLCGAFSERSLTAEGVQAIDAIPVLHLSVGAAPPDALLTGHRSLRSFYRERLDTNRFPKKRSLSPNSAPSIEMPRKKPALRISKQQDMEDLLTGFGA